MLHTSGRQALEEVEDLEERSKDSGSLPRDVTKEGRRAKYELLTWMRVGRASSQVSPMALKKRRSCLEGSSRRKGTQHPLAVTSVMYCWHASAWEQDCVLSQSLLTDLGLKELDWL